MANEQDNLLSFGENNDHGNEKEGICCNKEEETNDY